MMHHPLLLKLIRLYFLILSYLSPTLAAKSAHKLFHFPINSKRKNFNEKKIEAPEKFTIAFNKKINLQAYRWGKKEDPIVLLVHGWSTTSRSMSHFIEGLLKNNYQVISYDALRHGDSMGELSDLANWADSVHVVMKQIGKVECIIAHSFGGAAVTVASKLGLETKKLILIAPINNIESVSNKFGKHFGIPPNVMDKMRDYTWKNNEKSLLKYGTNWQDIFISDFKVPTLIYHDVNDKEISIENSKALCRVWVWAKLEETTGLGHRKILDDEVVLQGVLAFLIIGICY